VFYKSAEHAEFADHDKNCKFTSHDQDIASPGDYQRLYTWLQMMAYECHPNLVKDELSLISSNIQHSKRGKEEFHSLLNACAKGLGSAVHISASPRGSNACLETLLNSGADINKIYKDVGSPLHSATGAKNTSWLLEHGADATLVDNLGNTALHYAILSRDLSKIKALLNHDAGLVRSIGVHGSVARTAGQLDDWMYMRELADLFVDEDIDAYDFSPDGPYKDGHSVVMDFSVGRPPRYYHEH
jgi:hypothetical protein